MLTEQVSKIIRQNLDSTLPAVLEKWAKCFRQFEHSDTDTNMYLERLATISSLFEFYHFLCVAFTIN